MKYKSLSLKSLLILPILFLASCNGAQEEYNKINLYVRYSFNTAQRSDTGEYIAYKLFDYSRLGKGLEDIKVPSNLVAGDILSITYTGILYTLESYPGTYMLEDGEVIDYQFKQCRIDAMSVADATIKDIADEIRNRFDLANEYVILDNTGSFTTLDEYGGCDLYYTYDEAREVECPIGANCEVTRYPVAQLYAYNPRD